MLGRYEAQAKAVRAETSGGAANPNPNPYPSHDPDPDPGPNPNPNPNPDPKQVTMEAYYEYIDFILASSGVGLALCVP